MVRESDCLDEATNRTSRDTPLPSAAKVPVWIAMAAALVGAALGYWSHGHVVADRQVSVDAAAVQPIARFWQDGDVGRWDEVTGVYISRCTGTTATVEAEIRNLPEGDYLWVFTDGDAPNPSHVEADLPGVLRTGMGQASATDHVRPTLDGHGNGMLTAGFRFSQPPPDDRRTLHLYAVTDDGPVPVARPFQLEHCW